MNLKGHLLRQDDIWFLPSHCWLKSNTISYVAYIFVSRKLTHARAIQHVNIYMCKQTPTLLVCISCKLVGLFVLLCWRLGEDISITRSWVEMEGEQQQNHAMGATPRAASGAGSGAGGGSGVGGGPSPGVGVGGGSGRPSPAKQPSEEVERFVRGVLPIVFCL